MEEKQEPADGKKLDVSVTTGRQEQEVNIELLAFLREVADSAKSVRKLTSENLNKIIQAKESAIKEIQDVGKIEKQAIIKAGRLTSRKLKREASQHEKALSRESKRVRRAIEEQKEKTIEDIRSTASTSGMRRVPGKRISESKDYQKLTQGRCFVLQYTHFRNKFVHEVSLITIKRCSI